MVSHFNISFLKLLLLILFINCNNPEAEKNKTAGNSEWKKDNTLVFHIIGEPATLHPTNEVADIANFIFQYTHCFIISKDLENLQLRPGMVTALPEISEDQLQFHYTLRNDITWDDGSPVSAKDVEFSMKVYTCPLVENPNAKSYFNNLNNVRISDTDQLKFTMEMRNPYVQNISFLTDYPILQAQFYDPEGVIKDFKITDFHRPDFMPSAALKKWADDFNSVKYGREPAMLSGAGAYQVSQWESGSHITLIKKPGHWTGQLPHPNQYETAYPEKIIFKLNNDPNSQYLEFKSQTFDGSGYLSTKTLMKLQEDEKFNTNYHSAFLPTFNYSYAAMNMRPDGINHLPLFTDRKIRMAMALLTPVQEMIDLVFSGKSDRAVGPVSRLKPTFNEQLKPVEYDPEKAKKLLSEAGWTDSDGDQILDKKIDGKKINMEFELLFMNNIKEWGDMASLMAESMNKAGVKANLKPVDFSILYQKAGNHDFDMLLCAWSSDSQPDDHTQIWHTSSWMNNGSNFTGFGNNETDSLIELSGKTLDIEKRKKTEARFQEIVCEEAPYIFLMTGTRKIVIHKRFRNAVMYYEKPGIILSNLELY